MLTSDLAPTRSAILQLREEHDVILEAYDFLDEKRLLLAGELLRQLRNYEEKIVEYETLRHQAALSMMRSVQRHGLQGLQVYPGQYLENANIQTDRSVFMGVTLLTTRLQISEWHQQPSVSHPSPEAEQCRKLFQHMAVAATELAGLSGNLHRLMEEYRRTERRARALENVVIPEMQHSLRDMTAQLEELDQEDIVRVHLKRK